MPRGRISFLAKIQETSEFEIMLQFKAGKTASAWARIAEIRFFFMTFNCVTLERNLGKPKTLRARMDFITSSGWSAGHQTFISAPKIKWLSTLEVSFSLHVAIPAAFTVLLFQYFRRWFHGNDILVFKILYCDDSWTLEHVKRWGYFYYSRHQIPFELRITLLRVY